MTADLHAAALAALEARRALIEAATALPWFADEMNQMFVGNRNDGREHGLWEIVYAGEPDLQSLTPETSERERANADLIVAAVNAFGRMLDALEQVLVRHEPDPEPIELMLHMDEDCPTGECESGDGHAVIACKGCYPAWDGMDAHTVWPCPDARSVLAALGLEA